MFWLDEIIELKLVWMSAEDFVRLITYNVIIRRL